MNNNTEIIRKTYFILFFSHENDLNLKAIKGMFETSKNESKSVADNKKAGCVIIL